MTTMNILFDEVKSMKEYTYTEALAIARMYERRERSMSVNYNDPAKGKGMLVVSSIGIIDKNR